MKETLVHIATLMLLLSIAEVRAETMTGEVVGISDGDSITVIDSQNSEYKVRLRGIDAPEKGQPFWKVSKTSLSEMLYGKTIQVEWTKTDRYKRLIGKIRINDTDANLEQLKRGYAWHYKAFAREQPPEEAEEYGATEKVAKSYRIGLWSDMNPVPPWEWRKYKRPKQ